MGYVIAEKEGAWLSLVLINGNRFVISADYWEVIGLANKLI